MPSSWVAKYVRNMKHFVAHNPSEGADYLDRVDDMVRDCKLVNVTFSVVLKMYEIFVNELCGFKSKAYIDILDDMVRDYVLVKTLSCMHTYVYTIC